MSINTISFLASFTYCTASVLQLYYLVEKLIFSKIKWVSLGLLAVSLHGYVLYRWIDTPLGQNLSLSHMFSLVCWLLSLTTLMFSLVYSKKSLESLIFFLLPLTAISILLGLAFPGADLFQTKENPKTLLHIFTSTLAFGTLTLAALQATLLYIQNKLLKNHKSSPIMRLLPSLETMEGLLFKIIWLGFLLLTVDLLTLGFFSNTYLVNSHLHKIIFSALAWGLFALLLYQHHLSGLRGIKAIQWTLTGVFLLAIAYLTGKWLHRMNLLN